MNCCFGYFFTALNGIFPGPETVAAKRERRRQPENQTNKNRREGAKKTGDVLELFMHSASIL